MKQQVKTVDAIFDGKVFRPLESVHLAAQQTVKLTVRLTVAPRPWPDDTDEFYRELAEEDLRLANATLPGIRQTWPKSEEQS